MRRSLKQIVGLLKKKYQGLEIFFKDTKIAETFDAGTLSYGDQRRDIRIEVLPGFEDLKPEISQILVAASRRKVNEEQELIRKKKELVKKAKSESKFLGPFK